MNDACDILNSIIECIRSGDIRYKGEFQFGVLGIGQELFLDMIGLGLVSYGCADRESLLEEGLENPCTEETSTTYRDCGQYMLLSLFL